MILAIRTDKPISEIYLFENDEQILFHQWESQRELAKDLLGIIEKQVSAAGAKLDDIEGVAVYKGPGSFTGLRIGITVANSLAYSLSVPVVSETTDEWLNKSIQRLKNGDNEKTAMPYYGADANITTPTK